MPRVRCLAGRLGSNRLTHHWAYPRPPAAACPPARPHQVVLIELCAERRPILTADKIQEPSLSQVVAEIRSGRATPFQGIYSW